MWFGFGFGFVARLTVTRLREERLRVHGVRLTVPRRRLCWHEVLGRHPRRVGHGHQVGRHPLHARRVRRHSANELVRRRARLRRRAAASALGCRAVAGGRRGGALGGGRLGGGGAPG